MGNKSNYKKLKKRNSKSSRKENARKARTYKTLLAEFRRKSDGLCAEQKPVESLSQNITHDRRRRLGCEEYTSRNRENIPTAPFKKDSQEDVSILNQEVISNQEQDDQDQDKFKKDSQEDVSILNQEVISNQEQDDQDQDKLQHDSTPGEINNCSKETPSNQDVVTGLARPQIVAISTVVKFGDSQEQASSQRSLFLELSPLRLHGELKEFENQPKCCIVPKCSRNEVANPTLTFFSIPFEYRYRKIWCESIGREDLWHLPAREMSKYYFCNRHFEDKYFFQFHSKLVLLRNARPTLELPSIEQPEFKPQKFEGECLVVTCQNNTKDTPDLKFFTVPYRREIYSTWFRNIGVTRYCRYSLDKLAVCEEHFEKRYIKIDRKGNYVLMPYAEPTLNLPIPHEEIKLIETSDFRKRSLRLASAKKTNSTNPNKDEMHNNEKILNSELQKNTTVEFIDVIKIKENLNDRPAKRNKKISAKGFKLQRNMDDVNNDNYFFDEDSNTDDDNDYNTDYPNLVNAEGDSLLEVNIKNADEDLDSFNEGKTHSNNEDKIKIQDIIIPTSNPLSNSTDEYSETKPFINFVTTSSSLSDSGNVEVLISKNDSTKEQIKTLYENGSAETRLLFSLCDKYCKERSDFKIKLNEEILLDI